jgi:quinol-cytochrome oxidoreductase complex cytochrome b subunit
MANGDMEQDDPTQQPDRPEEKKRTGLLGWLYNTQVWKSIFRHGYPSDQKNRVLAILGNTFLHLHPAKVKKSGIKLEYTWCMGGLSFFLFLLETVTGIMLMFYYRPTTAHAYNDILALREHVPLGFLRELHRWGAHAMVITVWLHMFRVFLTGSYKPPREFNWCVGVVLLVLTLFMSFTGYLLPWDQIAIWAITVGAQMGAASPLVGYTGPFAPAVKLGGVSLVTQSSDVSFALLGGSGVGSSTLLRFYVFHCVAVPLIMAFLIAVHFWRVRKDGGISAPL